MQKIITLILVFTLCFSFITDLQARRFGGGHSFGISRPSYSHVHSNRPTQNTANQNMGRTNGMFGLLGGLALGGLFTYLLMGHGLSSGLIIGLLILAAIFFISRMKQSQLKPAGHSSTSHPNQFNTKNDQVDSGTQSQFFINQEKLLLDAKNLFMRLQAANDAKNLEEIKKFTTPAVLAEIERQFLERGDALDVTEILSLNAEIVNIENSQDGIFVSVRFSGLIKEELDKPAQPFQELWYFIQDQFQSDLKLTGITQG